MFTVYFEQVCPPLYSQFLVPPPSFLLCFRISLYCLQKYTCSVLWSSVLSQYPSLSLSPSCWSTLRLSPFHLHVHYYRIITIIMITILGLSSTNEWEHMMFGFWVCFIPLNMNISSSIHLSANNFYLCNWVIFNDVYTHTNIYM
jgi:hypothetical protein